MRMKRRNVNKLLLGAVAGIFAGTQARSVVAQEEATEGGEKHVCKGMNECKGQGGCETGDNIGDRALSQEELQPGTLLIPFG